jgi:biopolymer transport protein ExbD
MRRLRIYERVGIEPNLTSLIDVTFLLIVFFVLVSRLNEIEHFELNLPSPAQASTTLLESQRQVVINVLPTTGGQILGYRVGVVDFAPDQRGLEAMTAHLAALYELNPQLDVNVRADRATNYEHVEPVMRAISTAARNTAAVRGVAHVNLAVTKGR